MTIITGLIIAMTLSTPAEPYDFDALWDYNNPAETEAKFRDLLPNAESPDRVAYRAELLTQIARTLGLQQKFDAAHAMLHQVEPMLDKAGDRARVRYLLERGRTFSFTERQRRLFDPYCDQNAIDRIIAEITALSSEIHAG